MDSSSRLWLNERGSPWIFAGNETAGLGTGERTHLQLVEHDGQGA